MRRRSRPGKGAVVGSVLLHGLLAMAVVWGSRVAPAQPPDFVVYRVSIVSPPPQAYGEPELVAAPAPKVEKPRTEPEPVERAPAKKAPAPVQAPTTSKEASSGAAKGYKPDPGAEVGGEGLNVQLAGEQFPYPEYLDNIIRQVHRHFRWTGTGGLEAEVYFVILRDGSVDELRVARSSGNFRFDLQAQAAVELAGRRGAFGPLPPGFERDRLPISFSFEPNQ